VLAVAPAWPDPCPENGSPLIPAEAELVPWLLAPPKSKGEPAPALCAF